MKTWLGTVDADVRAGMIRWGMMLWLMVTMARASAATAECGGLDRRVRLTNEHADLAVAFDPGGAGALGMVVRDETHELEYRDSEVLLVVPVGAKIEIPPGFEAIGTAGDFIWVLPQSNDPGLLKLGISAEDLPEGLFAGPVEIRLRSLRGPGRFVAWQIEPGGDPQVRYDSKDGLGAGDLVMASPGGHQHLNFGFTAPGLYELAFQASGRPVGASQDLVSTEARFVFAVEPLPVAGVGLTYSAWRAIHWPGGAEARITDPDRDPDNDGWNNLAEYLMGTQPMDPGSRGGVQIERVTATDGRLRRLVSVPVRRGILGTAAALTVEAAPDPVRGPWTNLSLCDDDCRWTPSAAGADELCFVRALDESADGARFYRIRWQGLRLD